MTAFRCAPGGKGILAQLGYLSADKIAEGDPASILRFAQQKAGGTFPYLFPRPFAELMPDPCQNLHQVNLQAGATPT